MPKVLLVVDNRIRIVSSIPAEVRDALAVEFTYENPSAKKMRAFGFKRRVPKTLRSWDEDDGEFTLPRGGLGRVRRILREAGLHWRVEDRRSEGDPDEFARTRGFPEHRVELWPFQTRLVEAALAKENCLWRSPQGSGKTTASIAFAARAAKPALFVVSTGNLLDQWRRRCRKELDIEPGVLSGSKKRVGDITVAMQQTLRNHVGSLRGRFGTVVCDEVQEFAADTFQAVVDELDCRYRLGISADERRADGKEFLIHDQFGDVAEEVTHEELIAGGFIHEVEVRVVLSRFRADWYARLEKTKQKVAAYDKLLVRLSEDDDRNELVMDCVHRCFDEKEQVIVLSNRREHCHEIDRRCIERQLHSGLLIGGPDYRNQFEDTLDRLIDGEGRVGVGTLQAIGVGFDYPRIARGVIAVPIANSDKGGPQFRQFRGRFARTCDGKSNAILYYVHDPYVFGHRPIRHLCRWTKNVVVEFDGEWIPGRRYIKETPDEKPKTGGDDITLEEVLGR